MRSRLRRVRGSHGFSAARAKKTGRPFRTPGEESPAVCSEVQTARVGDQGYASKPPWPRQAISQPVM